MAEQNMEKFRQNFEKFRKQFKRRREMAEMDDAVGKNVSLITSIIYSCHYELIFIIWIIFVTSHKLNKFLLIINTFFVSI